MAFWSYMFKILTMACHRCSQRKVQQKQKQSIWRPTWYASCVHAGGLSSCIQFWLFYQSACKKSKHYVLINTNMSVNTKCLVKRSCALDIFLEIKTGQRMASLIEYHTNSFRWASRFHQQFKTKSIRYCLSNYSGYFYLFT